MVLVATTGATDGGADVGGGGGRDNDDDGAISYDEQLSSDGSGVDGRDLSSLEEFGTRSNRILRSLGQVLT